MHYCVLEERSSVPNLWLLADTEEQKRAVSSETQRSLSWWSIHLLLKRCKRLLGGGKLFPWHHPLRLGRSRVRRFLRGNEEMNKRNRVGIHIGHRRLNILHFLPASRQVKVKSETVVPPGHIAVRVGPQQTRFMVPVGFLNSPLFQSLLAQSKEAFGYHHHGVLSLPCHVTDFQNALAGLSISSTTRTSSCYGADTVQIIKQPMIAPVSRQLAA